MKLMEWSKEWTAAEGANDKPSRQTRRGKPLSLHLSFAPPRKAGQKEREKRREREQSSRNNEELNCWGLWARGHLRRRTSQQLHYSFTCFLAFFG